MRTSAEGMVADDLWRSLYHFGLYRLILGAVLLLAVWFAEEMSFDAVERSWLLRLSVGYVMLTLLAMLALQQRYPRFGLQLAFQVGSDIVCIVWMSYFADSIQSNLALLLLVTLAAAGMISRGRITLFYAALATIAILLEHIYAILTRGESVAALLQAGTLSIAYFAVAWLAHALSRTALASEKLAFVRGVDLSNMAEANRLVIQDMPDGVLVVDEQGVVRQSNPSAAKLLGYACDGQKRVLLETCSPLLQAMFAAWRQNRSLEQDVLQLPQTDSLVKVRFLPVQRDGFWGAVIVLEDMRRLQAEAQQVKLAALGRLTANIAHEVRNPLSSISYAAELLQEEGASEATRTRLTRIILDNTARLDRIVQDVMQINRRDRAQAEEIDLCQQLPTFVHELSAAEHVDERCFVIKLGGACRLHFDRGHWEQVLWNLCRNALRYCTRQPGCIELQGQVVGGELVAMEILDDGPGVAAEAQAKLFEPFFTTDVRGTGLGLYIARELCEANGARLSYVAGRGGACFRIQFGAKDGQ